MHTIGNIFLPCMFAECNVLMQWKIGGRGRGDRCKETKHSGLHPLEQTAATRASRVWSSVPCRRVHGHAIRGQCRESMVPQRVHQRRGQQEAMPMRRVLTRRGTGNNVATQLAQLLIGGSTLG